MMEVVELRLRCGIGVGLFGYRANRINARTHDGSRIDSASERDPNRKHAAEPPSARASSDGEKVYRDDEGQTSRDVSQEVVTREDHADDFAGIGTREGGENHRRGEK